MDDSRLNLSDYRRRHDGIYHQAKEKASRTCPANGGTILLRIERIVWEASPIIHNQSKNNYNNFEQKTGVHDFKTSTLF